MKYTTEEMIFAAHLNDLTQKFRAAEWDKAFKAWEDENEPPPSPSIEYTKEDRIRNQELRAAEAEYDTALQAFKKEWMEKNPRAMHVKEALRRLEEVAEIARAERSA